MDSLLAPNYGQEDHLSRSPHINHFDLSTSVASYDNFDYHQDIAHFPRTPSYNGSYQNSPYSTASELPPSLDLQDGLALLDGDNPTGFSFTREYDPDDYDNLAHEDAIISFDDEFIPSIGNNTVSVSVTPPMYDHSSPNAFDHSSPASSNGAEDDRRSRASSTSSYMHPSSPRLDLPQNFERLQFDSPHWSAAQLPDRYSPPHKPQSPPQLLIPSSPSTTRIDSPPIINAPDGDGVMNSGPQLHIVPATPVSGGGDTVQNVAFLGGPQSSQRDTSNWDVSQQHLASQGQNQGLPSSSYADHTSFNSFSGSNHDQSSSGMSYGTPESHISGASEQQQHAQQQSSAATVTSHQFLIPQMGQRSRSLSDTSARPPVWDTLPSGMMPPGSHAHQGSNAGHDGNLGSRSHDGGSGVSLGGTVNMNDVLPGPSSANHPHSSNANPNIHSPPNMGSMPRLSSSAGPTQTSFGRPQPSPSPFNPQQYSINQAQAQSDFLSADPISASLLRRAKSENNARMFGHRQVRSEDLRSSVNSFNMSGMLSPHPPNQQLSSANMFPPPSSASMEFIARQADPMSRQYLHPTEAVPSIASRGHHRRSSSGSRERPAGLGGWSSAASSARASPYPSPSASPRPGYNPLPEMGIPISSMGAARRAMEHNANGMMMGGNMGMSGLVGLGGMSGMNMGMGPSMSPSGNDGLPMNVSKVNVTTPSTADASQKRRKQPANFACPVPGCGSTFTRHFNLKGHLRSHAEEKPYQCKWPGCGKGFARQHDCKRHEQLHLNIRPFPCEGCKKNFARQDALNRHLRSEGGAECRKIQEELTTSSGTESATDLPPSSGSNGVASLAPSNGQANGPPMKPDPDGWAAMGGVVM